MADAEADTLPFPAIELDEPKPKLPEPALVRGGITSVIGLISILVGREIDPAIVEYLLALYVTVGPIALAWWIRRNVSPVRK